MAFSTVPRPRSSLHLISRWRWFGPCGEVLGPTSLGDDVEGAWGAKGGGEGRMMAAHRPQIWQNKHKLKEAGVQQKKNQPKMGVGGTRSGNHLHKPTLRFFTCFSVLPAA